MKYLGKITDPKDLINKEFVEDNFIGKVDEMPTADVTYLGKIVQYQGETNTEYTQGYFYICQEDAGIYSWKNIQVEDPIDFVDVEDYPISDINENLIYRKQVETEIEKYYVMTDSTTYTVSSDGILNTTTSTTTSWEDINANQDVWLALMTESDSDNGTIILYDNFGTNILIDKSSYTTKYDYELKYYKSGSWYKVGDNGGGTSNYNDLTHKPSINDVELLRGQNSYDLELFWTGTLAQYDAITTKNPNTLYLITDDFTVPTTSTYTKAEDDALLAKKQAITDTALETDAKTIVDAINENRTNIKKLSGVVSVKVVDAWPTEPVNNTMYYVGTAAPYEIYLYADDTQTYLGTSTIDFTEYFKKENILTSYDSSASNSQVYSAKYANDNLQPKITYGTADPSGGSSGDIYIKVEA